MKIALPANGKEIASHFGHCACFEIFNVENNIIGEKTTVNSVGEHKPGVLPQLLKDNGVNLIIADGIGQKAVQLFNSWGIEVIVGVRGLLEDAIARYLDGNLQGGSNGCSH
ncbi:MAG: NifB/NifX family molybdenum-iron cluster-binding protein [Gammaproteobacteria bacterium]|nr:NifB/NifX family molybdenum-iron cluster-binding protein [Gammaproteobacteria bacterium]